MTTLDEAMAIINAQKAEARKLPEGFYRLKCDVQNPNPDRRQKYDWRAAPTWAKGARFRIVDELRDGRELQRGKFTHHRICIDAQGNVYGEQLDRILVNLRPETVEDNPDTALEWAILQRGHSLEGCGADILCHLMRAGKVSLDDAMVALSAYEAEIEAADAAADEEPPP
jgi:hypothetical protein